MTWFGDLSIIEAIFYVLASILLFFFMLGRKASFDSTFYEDGKLAVRVKIVEDEKQPDEQDEIYSRVRAVQVAKQESLAHGFTGEPCMSCQQRFLMRVTVSYNFDLITHLKCLNCGNEFSPFSPDADFTQRSSGYDI